MALRPMSIFADFTFLGHGEDTKKWIYESIPMETGCIPLIDFDAQYGWIFHTLLTADGLKSEKKIAARCRVKTSRSDREAQIETELVAFLSERGDRVSRQVRCAAGIADVVTDVAVYEIKDTLGRDSMFHAVGQVLLYRQSINPALVAVVVGSHPDKDLVKAAASIGVEVMDWSVRR